MWLLPLIYKLALLNTNIHFHKSLLYTVIEKNFPVKSAHCWYFCYCLIPYVLKKNTRSMKNLFYPNSSSLHGWALNTNVVFIVFHRPWRVVWKNGYTVFHCRQHIQHGTKLTDKSREPWPLFHKELLFFLLLICRYILPYIQRDIISSYLIFHFCLYFLPLAIIRWPQSIWNCLRSSVSL